VYDKELVAWAAYDSECVKGDDDDDDDHYDRPTKREKKKGKRGSKRGQTVRSTIASSVIPSVPFASLSFGKSLGYGRNGCLFRTD
jgi:hypothetical protein